MDLSLLFIVLFLFTTNGRWVDFTLSFILRIRWEEETMEVLVLFVHGRIIEIDQWLVTGSILFILGGDVVISVINLSLKVHQVHLLLLVALLLVNLLLVSLPACDTLEISPVLLI